MKSAPALAPLAQPKPARSARAGAFAWLLMACLLPAAPGTALAQAPQGAAPAAATPQPAESPPPTALSAALRPQDWGPIQFPTPLSPFQKLRMVFFHQSPELPPAGTWTFASTATWANLWVNDPTQLIMDVEAWSLNEFVEYTVSDRVAVSLLLPFIYINGGFMDAIIEGFHGLFGLDNMGREDVPRNNVQLEVVTADGPVPIVDSTGETLWARAPVLSVRVRLTERDAPLAMALKASVDFPRVERDTNLVDSEGRDWGVGLALGSRIGERLAALFSLAYLDLRRGKLDEFRLATEQVSITAGLTYAFRPAAAFVAQVANDSPVTEGTETGFDRPTTNFSFGWKWRLETGTVLEFAIVENLFVSDNNADFALHGGATVEF